MEKLTQQQLWIDGPQGRLQTVMLKSVQPLKGIVLVAHPNPQQGGTNENKVVQTFAKVFARNGYCAFCPNLRGVGESAGSYDNGIGETDDMEAVREAALAMYGALPVILAGFSFGTFVQARLAQRFPPAGLALAGVAVGRWPIPNVPADTLVIHGEMDEIIPLSSVLDWARPQALAVIVLPGVGHFFHRRLDAIHDWVSRRWP